MLSRLPGVHREVEEACKRSQTHSTLAPSTQARRDYIRDKFLDMHELVRKFRSLRGREFDNPGLLGEYCFCSRSHGKLCSFCTVDRAKAFMTYQVKLSAANSPTGEPMSVSTLDTTRWDLIWVVR
jgi:hypothetical protein